MTKSLISFLLLFFLSTALQALDKECEAEIKAAVENEYKKEYKTILITSSKVEAATRENLSGFRYVALELQRRNLQRESECLGVLTILYDHHHNELSDKMVEIQHGHLLNVSCSLHMHVTHHDCLEVIIIKGSPKEIEKIASQISGLKGVKHAQLAKTAIID